MALKLALFIKRSILMIILIEIAGSGSIYAQSGSAGAFTANFIKQASTDNKIQISLGNLALKKGKEGGVKSFGSQMVADFTQADTQLNKMAATKYYQYLKSGPVDTLNDKIYQLKPDSAFDKYYVNRMLLLDERMLKRYEAALKHISDPGILKYVNQSLPILKDHLASVKALAALLHNE